MKFDKKLIILISILFILGSFIFAATPYENTSDKGRAGTSAVYHDAGALENTFWFYSDLAIFGHDFGLPGMLDDVNAPLTADAYNLGVLSSGRMWLGYRDENTNKYFVDTTEGDVVEKIEGPFISSGEDANWPFPETTSQQDIYGKFKTKDVPVTWTVKGYTWGYAPYNDIIIYEVTITNETSQSFNGLYWGLSMDPDIVSSTGWTNQDINRFSNSQNSVYDPSLNYTDSEIIKGLAEKKEAVDLAKYSSNNSDLDMYKTEGKVVPRNITYQWDAVTGETGPMDTNPTVTGARILGVEKNDGTGWVTIPATDGDGNITPGGPVPATHQWYNFNSSPGSDDVRYKYLALGGLVAEQYREPVTAAADMVYLQSVGPFDLAPNESYKITYVMANGYGKTTLSGSSSDWDPSVDSVGLDGKNETNEWDPMTASESTDAIKNGAIYNLAQKTDYAYQIYKQNYDVATPTSAPDVSYEVVDAETAMVRWSHNIEEDSYLGKKDFEGYKIYVSTDKSNWTKVAQYDKESYTLKPIYKTYTDEETGDTYTDKDTIIGYEEEIVPYGDNTGLQYSYKIKDITPGVPYYVAVVSYDRKYDYRITATEGYTAGELGGGGSNPDLIPNQTIIPEMEASKSKATVEIITSPKPTDVKSAKANIEHTLDNSDGLAKADNPNESIIDVRIANSSKVKDKSYEVVFNDPDSNKIPNSWSIIDSSSGETVLENIEAGLNSVEDPKPYDEKIIDGLVFNINDPATTIVNKKWISDINTDYKIGSSKGLNGYYMILPSYGLAPSINPRIDLKFVFHKRTGETVDITRTDGLAQTLPTYNIEVFAVVDGTEHKLFDENDVIAEPTLFSGGYYWAAALDGEGVVITDLTAYEQAGDSATISDLVKTNYYARCNLKIAINTANHSFIKTTEPPTTRVVNYGFMLAQNPDARKRPPEDGDAIYMKTSKNVTTNDKFVVNATPQTELEVGEETLKKVTVVPNPYEVGNSWSTMEDDDVIRFMNVPSKCNIHIYNVAGDLVRSLSNNGKGYVEWDVRNTKDQEVAPGVYVYVIYSPDGENKDSGTFSVIK